MVTQDVEQKHCSKLLNRPSDEDKCMADEPAGLVQQSEKITLESVHQAGATEASSTRRGKKVESQNSKNIQRNEKVAMKGKDKKVILSLVDGAGGLEMSLKELGEIDLSQQRIVVCENHKGARLVCDNTNRKEDISPMIDHDWCHDVMDITEQVKQLKVLEMSSCLPKELLAETTAEIEIWIKGMARCRLQTMYSIQTDG